MIKIPLSENFGIPKIDLQSQSFNQARLLFICSPNNPTGNCIPLEQIQQLASQFNGIVVVDEAYIDFAGQKSAIELISSESNIVVLQTLSKAYGLAGARIGMAFANEEIIKILNKIKPPYNVNALSQQAAITCLTQNIETVENQVKLIKQERAKLAECLTNLKIVDHVYPSEANFLLVVFKDAESVYKTLLQQGIVIRNRTRDVKNSLRITIGTPEENEILIKTLKTI